MGKFAKETFPDAGPVEHLRKLVQEAEEAIDEPTDIEEYADCLLTIFGAASKAGFSYSQLLCEANAKLGKVQTRKWKRNSDGTYQHIDNTEKECTCEMYCQYKIKDKCTFNKMCEWQNISPAKRRMALRQQDYLCQITVDMRAGCSDLACSDCIYSKD